MRNTILTIISGLILLLASACRVTFAPPEATREPTATPTATPTPVWFPPTSVPTSFPTPLVEPTPDLRPAGEELFADDFSDPALWTTGSDNEGTAAVSGGTLHLSLNAERSYLFSLRTAPVLSDFYAELTASPSLCSGEDEYGLVFRANDGDHYRFALTCDGRAKVDRYLGGSLTRQAGWLEDRIIPSLAPSSSRLAVWASGEEVRFFVNDFYLFSIRDTQLYLGTLGAFVHTSGQGDVSVTFDDLQVWAIQP